MIINYEEYSFSKLYHLYVEEYQVKNKNALYIITDG